MKETLARHGIAFVMMCVGTAGVLGLLVAMNEMSEGPQESDVERQVAFDPPPKKKPPRKKDRPKPEPKKQKQRPVNAPPPAPNLAGSLSSVSLGMPDVDMSEMDDMTGSLLGEARATVMTEDSVDNKPRPMQRTSADYPARARSKGVEGYVRLSLLINEYGQIERVKVLEAKPSGQGFEEAAAQSVRQWSFEPATYQGEPVKIWATQTINFKLS